MIHSNVKLPRKGKLLLDKNILDIRSLKVYALYVRPIFRGIGNNREALVTRRCRADQALRFVAKYFSAKGISTMLTSIVHSRQKKSSIQKIFYRGFLRMYVYITYTWMHATRIIESARGMLQNWMDFLFEWFVKRETDKFG